MGQQNLTGKNAGARSLGVLFVVCLLYIWISAIPFEDLASPPVPRAAVNQLIGAALAVILLLVAARMRLLPMLLRPAGLVFLTFGWLAIASLFATNILTAHQRLIFTFLITVMMSVLLLLPKDKRQFASWLAGFSIALLLLCYLGVILWSSRAVHQSFDLSEPQLAGDWRGIFNHKNSAAPAMIMICLIGLFLRKAWSKLGGTLIFLLALFFLYMTNGKTAALLLPVTMALQWYLERHPRHAVWLPMTLLAVMSIVVLGASFSPQLRSLVEALGVDATFTGRTDIWQLALETVPQSLLVGQGFQSFWYSDALTGFNGYGVTWAVNAAHAHNAYIEALLNGGVPAFILILLWLVIIPSQNYEKAMISGADLDLNRLFARIWLYAIFAACLESSFFTGNGAAWSTALLAVFGLHMQAKAVLRSSNIQEVNV